MPGACRRRLTRVKEDRLPLAIAFSYRRCVDLLRHLRFFSTLADTRHFGDAARDLGMTQPPLSQGLQRLEGHLGVRLFDRSARGVSMTTPGHQLLPAARDLLRAADDLLEHARQMAVPTVVRVGVAADLEDWIPVLMAGLAAVGAPVLPLVAGSGELVDEMRSGALDVAVARHPGVFDGLVTGAVHNLAQVRTGAPAGVPWRRVGLPVAVPPRHHQPAAHDQFVDVLRRAGHDGTVVEAADSAQRRALVAAGRAIGVVPAVGTVTADAQCPPLRVRVLVPAASRRRSEVDHDGTMTVLDEVLAG